MRTTTVNNDSFKNSLMASGFLHLLLILFLYFGLPQIFKPLPAHHEPVPFEIVEIADITNTRTKDQEEKPQPPQPQAKPTPPAPAPTPVPQPPQPPKPPPPQPKAEEPLPQAESIKPQPVQKAKPAEAPKPQPDMLANVLKNVARLKPAEAVKPTEAKTETKQQPVQEAKSMAPTLSNRLTISEEDLLRRQIGMCWNMPIGARDVQNLIVEVVIDVNPDRTVQHAEVVDQSRMASDSFFRAAAEAALRALRDPRCTPLALPPDKYDQWKRIDFTFDPRDIQ